MNSIGVNLGAGGMQSPGVEKTSTVLKKRCRSIQKGRLRRQEKLER